MKLQRRMIDFDSIAMDPLVTKSWFGEMANRSLGLVLVVSL